MAKVDVVVELFYSGDWHQVAAYTRDPIRITRGRANESSQLAPASCSLSLDNRSGDLSPRNPMSTLYGLIGRNTPLRVRVDSDVRFIGEVESWPQRSNVKGNDVWVPVLANGITRRLFAPGTAGPAWSALRRAVEFSSTQPLAYWPMESKAAGDTAVGDVLLSPVPGVPALTQTVAGASFGRGEAGAGSSPVPDFRTGGTLRATIPDDGLFNAATGYTVEFVARFDNNPSASPGQAVWWFAPGNTPASFNTATGPDMYCAFGEIDGAGLGTVSNSPTAAQDGRAHHYRFTVQQSGGNILIDEYVDGVLVDSASPAGTVNRPTSVYVQLGNLGEPLEDQATGIGHVTFWHGVSPPVDTATAAAAHVGETAADRIERVCTEAGIPITIVGDAASSQPLGPQLPGTIMEILLAAADADGGILFEQRDTLGFGYRTRADLYNQDAAITLDYAAGGEVAPPLEPVEDTDQLVNDVTVTRTGGSSARAVQETGRLNVQLPADDPQGVGRYQKDVTLTLESDTDCEPAAHWVRHVGTWDEARFPVVTMDLTAMDADGKAALATDAAGLDIGDRLLITSMPLALSPDTVDQHVQGFTETIESHRWTIETNATPAGPYRVAIVSDTADPEDTPRVGTNTATLASGIDSDDTSLSVSTGADGLWTTDGGAFPMDVSIGGERIRLSGISGASSPQTFTVSARSVNGIVKSHSFGATVKPWRTATIGR